MKKTWNAPAVEALDINATENWGWGINWDGCFPFIIGTKPTKPGCDPKDPPIVPPES